MNIHTYQLANGDKATVRWLNDGKRQISFLLSDKVITLPVGSLVTLGLLNTLSAALAA